MSCLDPLKCHILSLKSVVGQLCKPRNMKDERLVSKVEGKTNFSTHLKQFDGLTRLNPSHLILRQIYAVCYVYYIGNISLAKRAECLSPFNLF